MDKLISSMALGFYGIAILGVVAHAVKKWAYREISYSVFDYLFTVDPRATFITVATAISGVITGIASGVITDVSSTTQVVSVFMTAFAIDSSILPATAGARK